MKSSVALRFALLAIVAMLLSAPLYWQLVGTLVWLVPTVLGAGWLVRVLLQAQLRGGQYAPSAVARTLGERLWVLLVKDGVRLSKQLWRLLTKAVRARPWLASIPIVWLGLAYAIGYRLPWFDRHPTWSEFPHLADSRLIVEEISETELKQRYHYQFPAPRDRFYICYFPDTYRTNLRNVRSLGSQVTDNEFKWPWWSGLLKWSSPNETGHQDTSGRSRGPQFEQNGYEYLQLNVGNATGYFKETSGSPTYTNLEEFYQFNYPATDRDTLFLCYYGTFWLVRGR